MIEKETLSVRTLAGREIATIVLNGYNIAAGGPLGDRSAMRSFKVVTGDVEAPFERQEALALHSPDGRQASVRIAARPATKGSAGLIEFL
jgi:hypothetical protein